MPPASTEQVLHPEKLADREPPIEFRVRLPAAFANQFTLSSDDVMGELGLRLFLMLGLADDAAETGAAGWGGDRAMLFAPRASTSSLTRAGAPVTVPDGGSAMTSLIWHHQHSDPARSPGCGRRSAGVRGRVLCACSAARYPTARSVAFDGVTAARETSPGRVAAVARRGRHVVVLDRVPSQDIVEITREITSSPDSH